MRLARWIRTRAWGRVGKLRVKPWVSPDPRVVLAACGPPDTRPPLSMLPRTRGDCPKGRPCWHLLCKHNLLCDLHPYDEKSDRYRVDRRLVEALADGEYPIIPHSCVLDIAARGGITHEEVADVMGVSLERARQLEESAIKKLRSSALRRYVSEVYDPIPLRVTRRARQQRTYTARCESCGSVFESLGPHHRHCKNQDCFKARRPERRSAAHTKNQLWKQKDRRRRSRSARATAAVLARRSRMEVTDA